MAINKKKIDVTEEAHREISIVAAHEDRPIYEIMGEAWNLYKLVAIGKPIKGGKKTEKPESVSVAEVIAH